MKRDRPALLVRVLTEIGKGRISEHYIKDKHEFVHGETDGRHIRINPAIATCDTVIHEALHRLEPSWSETYVRRTTTWLLRRMSDEQIEQLFQEYQQIAKRRRKRAKRGVRPVDSGDQDSSRQEKSGLRGGLGPAQQLSASATLRRAGLEGDYDPDVRQMEPDRTVGEREDAAE